MKTEDHPYYYFQGQITNFESYGEKQEEENTEDSNSNNG